MNSVLRIVQGTNPASRHPNGSIIINKTDELMADPCDKMVMMVIDVTGPQRQKEYPGRHKDYIVATLMATNKIDYQIVFRGASLHLGAELKALIHREIYLEAVEMRTKEGQPFYLWSTELIKDDFDD